MATSPLRTGYSISTRLRARCCWRESHCSFCNIVVTLVVRQAASQLVTRSTRHIVNSSQVNSSPGRLVTQLTRHKEAVNSSQANIKAVLPTMYWCPQLLGLSFQKAKKNSQQVVTRMQDFTSEFSKIFRG